MSNLRATGRTYSHKVIGLRVRHSNRIFPETNIPWLSKTFIDAMVMERDITFTSAPGAFKYLFFDQRIDSHFCHGFVPL